MKVAFDRHVVVIDALTKRFPTSFPISVGQDSRLLLAFASGGLDQVDRFYTHVTNFNTTRDDEIAQTPYELMGVEHYRPYSLGESIYSNGKNFYLSPAMIARLLRP